MSIENKLASFFLFVKNFDMSTRLSFYFYLFFSVFICIKVQQLLFFDCLALFLFIFINHWPLSFQFIVVWPVKINFFLHSFLSLFLDIFHERTTYWLNHWHFSTWFLSDSWFFNFAWWFICTMTLQILIACIGLISSRALNRLL